MRKKRVVIVDGVRKYYCRKVGDIFKEQIQNGDYIKVTNRNYRCICDFRCFNCKYKDCVIDETEYPSYIYQVECYFSCQNDFLCRQLDESKLMKRRLESSLWHKGEKAKEIRKKKWQEKLKKRLDNDN